MPAVVASSGSGAHDDFPGRGTKTAFGLRIRLTVRSGEAASHAKHGWETLTDAAIRVVSEGQQPVVFVLWGKSAERKVDLIDLSRHRLVVRAHPSPLSAHRGFLGTKPFSAIQSALAELGLPEFDFRL